MTRWIPVLKRPGSEPLVLRARRFRMLCRDSRIFVTAQRRRYSLKYRLKMVQVHPRMPDSESRLQ